MPEEKEGWRKPPKHRRREMLEAQYVENVLLDARVSEKRAVQDLRRRKDGTPSAVPPQPTLPVSNWATVQEPPDGGEHSLPDRLREYQDWLCRLKKNGLYDGPTELRTVNTRRDDD